MMVIWRFWLGLGLKREERVNLAINMSSVCIRVCVEGVKAHFKYLRVV